ncbi:hypothetical protein [Microbispora sp. NBRC 16548]|uniref:hypothetical protein n=1 Tax=Microbispora sp. NBRC 16548 TaxID=3030994 RepID=UPI0024A3CBB5|nr:hypothetical protein [Microbispora sp. NBRC 16548]GLX10822.1 hypothetical protein Misp03_77480 [Microbispora sp. NBRC 16548]
MRALDPTKGPVERFACELRALRAAAGEPPFWKMARRCEVSKSALASAVAGYQLPSEKVVRNFVLACGGDWPRWRERWMQAVAAAVRDPGDAERRGGALVPVTILLPVPAEHGELAGDEPSGENRISVGFALVHDDGTGGRKRRAWPWAIAGAAATGVAVSAALMIYSSSLREATMHASPSASVSMLRILDGTDPTVAGCRTDKVILSSAPVLLQHTARLRGRRLAAGTKVGTINLMYSARCAGAWPWFNPTPGLNPDPNDTTVGQLTVEGIRPADNTTNLWKMGHIDSAYGNLLLTGMGCVRASARLDMVGQNVFATGQTDCLPRV